MINKQINKDNLNSDCIEKYAILFEYDGANFAGSQIQTEIRTVQDELNKALSIILRTPSKAILSGRTDTGVNAFGQVAHFVSNQKLDIYKTLYSLNGILPNDIAVRALEKVHLEFDARKSALKRWYRFSIYNHPYRSALNTKNLHIYYHLNENLINEALQTIIGTHNFDSFKCLNSTNTTSECTIYMARSLREGDYVHIDIVASRFVYNMVRIIVGTLLQIGSNQRNIGHLYEVLMASDRTKAGVTVKPQGLTLMAVEYPEKYNLFKLDKALKIVEIMKENITEAPNENLYCKAS